MLNIGRQLLIVDLFIRGKQLIKLMELGLEEFLVGELGFVFSNHGRGERATECITKNQ